MSDDLTIEKKIDLRERIATEVHRQQWYAPTADAMYAWIMDQSAPKKVVKAKKSKGKRGPKLGVKRGPYKKKKIEVDDRWLAVPWEASDGKPLGAVKPKMRDQKRPYTKKAKFWKSKKKK